VALSKSAGATTRCRPDSRKNRRRGRTEREGPRQR